MSFDKAKEDCVERPRTPVVTGPIIELRGREVIFAISVFFLTAIVVGLIVVLASNKIKDPEVTNDAKCSMRASKLRELEDLQQYRRDKDQFCLEPDCVRRAAAILDRMDLSVDPCDDFYQYSCGGWLRKKKGHVVADAWGVDDEAKDRVRRRIGALFDRNCTDGEDPESAECKMRTLYEMCNDTASLDKIGVKPLTDILEKFGGWSAFDDFNIGYKSGKWQIQKVLVDLHFTYGVDAFFTVSVEQDDNSTSSANILHLRPLSNRELGLYYRRPYKNDTDKKVLAYKTYMETVARLFDVTPNKTLEFVNNTFNLEKSLVRIARGDDAIPERITVDELVQRSPHIIKWLEYLRNLSTEVAGNTTILVTDVDYFANLSTVLVSTNEDYINSYFVWRLISRQAAQFLSQPFREAHEKYMQEIAGSHVPSGTFATRNANNELRADRRSLCQDFVVKWMGTAVTATYWKNHYIENTTEVMNIVDNVNKTLKRKLNSCHWMDKETKKKAEEKLNTMSLEVGVPKILQNETELDEYYREFNISGSDTIFDVLRKAVKHLHMKQKEAYEFGDPSDIWVVDRREISDRDISAVYSPANNRLSLNVGLLQEPYFDPSAPQFLNYGSLASRIAREMTRAFNLEGSTCNSTHAWWSDETWAKFHRETHCFLDHYGEMNANCHPENGHLTLHENIADIGGLRIAYEAYKGYETDNKQRLPINNITNEQYLFIAFAQSYCKQRSLLNVTRLFPVEEARVNGAVSHLNEFSTVFKCKPDTKNTRNKRLIW